MFNHYHRIIHSREQAQAFRDRLDKEQAALEQDQLESNRNTATQSGPIVETEESRHSAVPKSNKRNKETAERREIRIESRMMEPDPTKTHEPSTWTGERFSSCR